ncbi:protein of unknown function [Agreia sp. COWG]|nr:protein of unknown function [Agreia sp. COWG]
MRPILSTLGGLPEVARGAHAERLDFPIPRAPVGGGLGIRTLETFLPTSFQDWLHRPLGQPSMPGRTEQALSLTDQPG